MKHNDENDTDNSAADGANDHLCQNANVSAVLVGQEKINDWQQSLYKDLHQHPELGHQEVKTAVTAAAALREYGYEVHENIGSTGLVGILKNGDGPVVLMRADMETLPRSQPELAQCQNQLSVRSGSALTRSLSVFGIT